MNDTILTLSLPEFEICVSEAFKLCRDGMVTSLEASPLAHSVLVADCLFEDKLPGYGTRGRALYSILRWAVTQLRPAGEPSPTSITWRPYHLLHAFYLEGQRVSTVAELLGIVETHFYEVRRQAIAAVSTVLYAELHEPHSREARRDFVLEDRYQGLTATEQTLVRAVAIFDRPVPANWLLRLVERRALPDSQSALRALGPGWVLSDEHGLEVLLRPELRTYLTRLLKATERVDWHAQAARLYLDKEDALTAAAHWRSAGDHKRAAETLTEQARAIIAENGLEALRTALAQFHAHELRYAPDLWARVKLLTGEIVEGLEDLPAAAAEYSAALQKAVSTQLKARACHHLAKIFVRSQKIDEALATYQRGIALLAPPDPLLITLYIYRAWIYIQVRPDQVRAEADLRLAQTALEPNDLTNQIDLHNAWASFYTFLVVDPNQAIHHRLQCWLLAQELGDIEKQLVAALGVGQDYLYQGRYGDALSYLEQGLTLAVKAGDRAREAQYRKVIGNAYFFRKEYPAALETGQQAHAIFREMGNHQWLAHTCCDLAEVAVELSEWDLGHRYWAEGSALAEISGDEKVKHNLEALAHTYPRLRSGRLTVTERQQRLFDYLEKNGRINNSQYQEITGVQRAQAARDLKEFVQCGLICSEGTTRDRVYIHATPQSPHP